MSQERADVWLAAWEAHAADAQIARDGAYWDSAVDLDHRAAASQVDAGVAVLG